MCCCGMFSIIPDEDALGFFCRQIGLMLLWSMWPRLNDRRRWLELMVICPISIGVSGTSIMQNMLVPGTLTCSLRVHSVAFPHISLRNEWAAFKILCIVTRVGKHYTGSHCFSGHMAENVVLGKGSDWVFFSPINIYGNLISMKADMMVWNKMHVCPN